LPEITMGIAKERRVLRRPASGFLSLIGDTFHGRYAVIIKERRGENNNRNPEFRAAARTGRG
jgi:hypothetical protein